MTGAFGKLPGRGDFVTRGLDPSFVEPWHDWLAAELPAARAAAGERFVPAYLQAPVWRFALPAGLAGRTSMTGILMPSVDAVGREFPLTLAAAGGITGAHWYDRLEEHSRSALEDGCDVPDWLDSLGALPDPDADGMTAAVTFWGDGSPFVTAGSRSFPDLPRADGFLRLIDDAVVRA